MFFSLLFFFFSSRRRHTRFSRDWSSDVCSSDLLFVTGFCSARVAGSGPSSLMAYVRAVAHGNNGPSVIAMPHAANAAGRSEERRVGKECRARWAAEHEKEK